LVYVVLKFRTKVPSPDSEPAQVYGSTQIELAWTIIPILIVVVLFLATARVIHAIQDARKPASAVEVTAIGHQFWWEFRYPSLGIVTANELHVPVSDPAHPTPTFLKLLSADTDHSFWVPQLGGKTDLIPNRVNEMWVDPHQTGIYLGQCAQYCGTQHAKMLLRVSVDSPESFDAWAHAQKQPANRDNQEVTGRHVFEATACVNCHAVGGTNATGRVGPDLSRCSVPICDEHIPLEEHHTSGAMSRMLPHLAELQPEFFCEISPELATVRGVENGGWVTLTTPRGLVEARALVTPRMRPLLINGKMVHQVGVPYHWGYRGLVKGDSANDLVAISEEPNVRIMEAKGILCDLSPGRRARGKAAIEQLRAHLGGSNAH
jgi:cytochrome c oxidase subunit II